MEDKVKALRAKYTKAKPRTVKVAVTRCSHCGLERFGFRPHKGPCPRCDRTFRPVRWITDPPPNIIRQAEREDPES